MCDLLFVYWPSYVINTQAHRPEEPAWKGVQISVKVDIILLGQLDSGAFRVFLFVKVNIQDEFCQKLWNRLRRALRQTYRAYNTGCTYVTYGVTK